MVATSKNRKKRRGNFKREKPEFEQKLLDLARVTRVVKGGRRFRFRATVVAGNRKGRVGVGVAKGTDVSQAIQKAFADAKKHMITVKMDQNGTIAHDVMKKKGSAKVLLKTATEGKGIIAGGAVRTVVDLCGVKNVVSKSMGTSNKLNVARATVEALSELAEPKNPMVFKEEKKKDDRRSGRKFDRKKEDKPTKSEKKPAEAKPEKKAEAKPVKAEKTDFTKIEGVGPKIAQTLTDAGIETFADLANKKPEEIQEVIKDVRGSHDATTWPQQASLAAEGKWDELKQWQDELDGGKA